MLEAQALGFLRRHFSARRIKLSSSNSEIAFIVGCGRSGNTLLRREMMENLSIYIPPETYIIPGFIRKVLSLPKLGWLEYVSLFAGKMMEHPEADTFRMENFASLFERANNVPTDSRNLGELIRCFYLWQAEINHSERCQWVGDKTPLYALHLGVLSAVFPNAFYIYIERDPVDVVASYMQSGLIVDFDKALDRWLRSKAGWESFKNTLSKKSFIEIQYEDLVNEPLGTVEKISLLAGIPKLMQKNELMTMGDVERRLHHKNVALPVFTSSIGKGRQFLSEAQIRCIERAVR